MSDIIQKALIAKRESKHIEFKQAFDVSSPREWCEVIKDIVAMANSGGGVIIFGLDNKGIPSGQSVTALGQLDPSDVSNKIAKYTGPTDLEFEIRELSKKKQKLMAFLVHGSGIPVIFEKPGTYDIGGGRQNSAFSAGMVYFRHGAKSEPGTSDDIRLVIERQLEFIRKSWLKGVRKIVQAPPESQIIATAPHRGLPSRHMFPSLIRAVADPNATPILLTREPQKAEGILVHEQVSNAISDEINNVIDANRILAKGQQHFFLGDPVYYRIYAERHHVTQPDEDILLLLRSAVCDFYAPGLYWLLRLPGQASAKIFADIYLYPKNPHIYYLMRLAILLGKRFSGWLLRQWADRWEKHPQPPSFYWTFTDMVERISSVDSVLLASRLSPNVSFNIDVTDSRAVKELLDKPGQAALLLSKACMRVFEGDRSMRTVARNLDFLAYGREASLKLRRLGDLIIQAIGHKKPGDIVDTKE